MEFLIRYEDNKLTENSKQILRESFDEIKKKGGQWLISAVKRSYTPSRYKFLFDCVYKDALPDVKHLFHIVENGKQRPIETTEELHMFMKARFTMREMIDMETGECYSVPATTTDLNDPQFYNEFEEQVIEYLTDKGAYGMMGCLTREEWVERKKGKQKVR